MNPSVSSSPESLTLAAAVVTSAPASEKTSRRAHPASRRRRAVDEAQRAALAADIVDSPVGPLLLVVGADGTLVRLEFLAEPSAAAALAARQRREPEGTIVLALGELAGRGEAADAAGEAPWDPAALAAVARALDRYFAGGEDVLGLAVAPRGTAFQCAVWERLRRIRRGETASYREIAEDLGRPAAVRAVGQAVGRNPIAIVIPCHRVVGTDGSLTGFGGGLPRKRQLLVLEGVLAPGAAGSGEGDGPGRGRARSAEEQTTLAL
jgi:methylated-DNA-[protein]-cysteine S-methyltransferase